MCRWLTLAGMLNYGAPISPTPQCQEKPSKFDELSTRLQALKPLQHSLLLEDRDPKSISAVQLIQEHWGSSPSLPEQRALQLVDSATFFRVEKVLSPEVCASVRHFIDRSDEGNSIDSVDGLPEHQAALTRYQAAELLGAGALASILGSPRQFFGLSGAYQVN